MTKVKLCYPVLTYLLCILSCICTCIIDTVYKTTVLLAAYGAAREIAPVYPSTPFCHLLSPGSTTSAKGQLLCPGTPMMEPASP